MMGIERGTWLSAQVSTSARRLMDSSPSLLSPTGRSLREAAVAWVSQDRQLSSQTPGAAPDLKIVAGEGDSSGENAQTELSFLVTLPGQ